MIRATAFDPNARLVARDAMSVEDLRRQFGSVGRINGPRVGPGRRTTISNEAYLLRRLVLHLASNGALEFPISVEHGDAPDLVVWHAGQRIPIEVTEVCPPEDGRAFAVETGACEIGNYSLTGLPKALADLQHQIQAAIDRKATKEYARERNSAVLVYPNSDASMWVALFKPRRPLPFLSEIRIEPFRSLHVLWSRDRFYSVTRQ